MFERRPYTTEEYSPDLLQTWLDIAQRQAAKDRILIPALARHFVAGRVLELGAGVGQLSKLLIGLGHKVVPSDYAGFFIDYMRKDGLEAHRVDATDIRAAGLGQFENIFCQGIPPFITSDYAIVKRTYASVLDALTPAGRLVQIHPEAWAHVGRVMADHLRLCREAGFTQVKAFRNQLLPSTGYVAPFSLLARPAEALFGPSLGSRFVIVASRPSE
jgi:SAM-dependent methyltransferase